MLRQIASKAAPRTAEAYRTREANLRFVLLLAHRHIALYHSELAHSFPYLLFGYVQLQCLSRILEASTRYVAQAHDFGSVVKTVVGCPRELKEYCLESRHNLLLVVLDCSSLGRRFDRPQYPDSEKFGCDSHSYNRRCRFGSATWPR